MKDSKIVKILQIITLVNSLSESTLSMILELIRKDKNVKTIGRESSLNSMIYARLITKRKL
jgi:hypothetical protein